MILLSPAPAAGPDPAMRIAKRSTLVGCSVVKIDSFSVHSDSEDMINRHTDHISGIPLDTGKDQEIVILPQMPDFTMVGDGNKIITGFPVNADCVYRMEKGVLRAE